MKIFSSLSSYLCWKQIAVCNKDAMYSPLTIYAFDKQKILMPLCDVAIKNEKETSFEIWSTKYLDAG